MSQKMRPLTVQDMLDNGLLWYINRVALHPRGLALAVDGEGKFLLICAPDGIFSFPTEIDEEKVSDWEHYIQDLKHPESTVHTITDLPDAPAWAQGFEDTAAEPEEFVTLHEESEDG